MNESCHCISYSRCTWVFEHPTVKGFFKSLISATYKNRQRGTVRQLGGKKSRRKSNRCLMMIVVEHSTWIQSAESKVPTNIHHRYVPVFVYVCVIQLICTRVEKDKEGFHKMQSLTSWRCGTQSFHWDFVCMLSNINSDCAVGFLNLLICLLGRMFPIWLLHIYNMLDSIRNTHIHRYLWL